MSENIPRPVIVKTCNIIAKMISLLFMGLKINWDGLGIATSLVCAIHCAVLPLLLTSLPVFGNDIIHNLYFEWAMILLAFVVGSYSLFHGYAKHHRSLMPVLIFTTGFLFLVSKQFFHEAETYLLIPAVLLIIGAHYLNYRLCHRSRCVSAHHKH
ncbi:MAG: MerC protein [Ferruginibacter sp.]|nr:MerC protein [Ferruginibacter sp.]